MFRTPQLLLLYDSSLCNLINEVWGTSTDWPPSKILVRPSDLVRWIPSLLILMCIGKISSPDYRAYPIIPHHVSVKLHVRSHAGWEEDFRGGRRANHCCEYIYFPNAFM